MPADRLIPARQAAEPAGSSPRDEVVLAVDIGTSGARAFVYDAGYAVRAATAAPIATTSGAGGTSTQAWAEINGERSPLWRDDLRGALIGFASHHGPIDVARAALDGVAGAVEELAAAVAMCVTKPAEVRLTGGFLHDDSWAQLVTDALGVATSVPDPAEATATGAAVLGWLSLGHAAPRPPSPARATRERSPDPAAHAALSAKSALMRDLRGLLFPRP
jgi:sugar (pentulose or hexulose) kinase